MTFQVAIYRKNTDPYSLVCIPADNREMRPNAEKWTVRYCQSIDTKSVDAFAKKIVHGIERDGFYLCTLGNMPVSELAKAHIK